MKQGVGCDYIIRRKGPNNTEFNKSVIVYIPGSGMLGINGNSKIVSDVFISKKEYDLLTIPIKTSKTGTEKSSVFNFLIEQRIKEPKKGGIIVQECGFQDLPADKQKEYDPVYFNKLETQRKNQAIKDRKALDAENETERGD